MAERLNVLGVVQVALIVTFQDGASEFQVTLPVHVEHDFIGSTFEEVSRLTPVVGRVKVPPGKPSPQKQSSRR